MRAHAPKGRGRTCSRRAQARARCVAARGSRRHGEGRARTAGSGGAAVVRGLDVWYGGAMRVVQERRCWMDGWKGKSIAVRGSRVGVKPRPGHV
ncbi:hypothetical protein PSPO01_09809 [Paraphaeosphaeria sporulosa]